jgi:hypothetical protein
MRCALRSFAAAACVLLVSALAAADQITGSPTGLANPTCILTFDDLGAVVEHQPVTQYAAVSFSGFGWDNGDLGQAGATGFSGGNLVNGYLGFPPDSTMSITFNTIVNAAAFAVIGEDSNFTIQAYLNGSLVDTMNLLVPKNPGAGYVGFANESFNQIAITRNSGTDYLTALALDNLQFNCGAIDPNSCIGPGPIPEPPPPDPGPQPPPDPDPGPPPDPTPAPVPEPASLALFGSGISMLTALLRRARHK